MSKLIIHVGPGKCGSTSIQHFFATQKRACVQNTRYTQLNPLDIKELNRQEPGRSVLTSFTEFLIQYLDACDTLIISHEYLFQCPYAVKNICAIAKRFVADIFIVGYARRQSDFIISAYSQWLFRSPKRVKEVSLALGELEIDPTLYSGLERQLMASIGNDFYSARQLSGYSILDWHSAYHDISRLVRDWGVIIKCGVLPNKASDFSLIQDFCEKTGLTLNDEMTEASRKVSNLSFNQDIIEAISNAVHLDFEAPGPHENNEILERLSTNIAQSTHISSGFLSNLKSYIDTYFENSNRRLCKEYGLSEAYFTPPERIGKQEIMEIINNEDRQRALNYPTIINNYRRLSGRIIELCLKLAKEGGTG